MNDVNESMQTSTNVTENNSNDPALWENTDDDFRWYIVENELNQKTSNLSVLLIPKERMMMALTVILKKNISTEFLQIKITNDLN